MLYKLLKWVMQATVRIFFRSITIRNGGGIPAQGPLILLANHPSTFMDPIVIASFVKREVFFLGKGELFKGKFAKRILSALHIIPVYRKQDDPTMLSRNTDTFRKCYEHLEKGGAILIFPEGVSVTERKLKPVKAGASHIALGAELRNDFKLGVKIVNIGLNYEDQHKFNRDLYINIDEPIAVTAYEDRFKADKTATIKALTTRIQLRLEALVISIADERTDAFVKDIETLYRKNLKEGRGVSGNQPETEFSITRNIVKALQYYSEKDPGLVAKMRERTSKYLKKLSALQLDDESLSGFSNNPGATAGIKEFLFVIFGFPLYLFGMLNNFLPFETPGFIALKIVKSRDYKGAIGMVLGIFTFLFFYSIQAALVQHFFKDRIITFLYLLSLPPAGFFAWHYWKVLGKMKTKWWLLTLFYRRRPSITGMIAERESIIGEFDKIRADFLQQFPDAI